jgi:hypothetical protein
MRLRASLQPLLCALLLATPTVAVAQMPPAKLGVYHHWTYFAGQGQCAFHFILDGQGFDSELRNLVIRLAARDSSGGQLGEIELSAPVVGGARVNGVAQAFGETDCEAARFQVVRASAQQNGRPLDLLRARALDLTNRFKPAPITLR